VGTKRTYGEACATAHALDIVGERWALLVVRELLMGPKRFTDLREGIVHASPNVLAQRLRELEDARVVQRRRLPPPAAAWVYELTGWGRELEPVVTALGRWGARSPTRPRECGMSADSYVLAMRTIFDPGAARDLELGLELHLGEHVFEARVRGGALDIARGTPSDPDAVVTGTADALGSVLLGERPLADALRAGDVEVAGDRRALERFLRLFPQPEPAAAA
jgi:DNA-binding HxlR family transcriptional regulator